MIILTIINISSSSCSSVYIFSFAITLAYFIIDTIHASNAPRF